MIMTMVGFIIIMLSSLWYGTVLGKHNCIGRIHTKARSLLHDTEKQILLHNFDECDKLGRAVDELTNISSSILDDYFNPFK